MKMKLLSVAAGIIFVATSCITTMAPVAGVTVYSQIPMAPNVVLTVETPVIAAPAANYIWIDGYWTWDYGYREYVWVPGRWEAAPYAGAVWLPGYWEYYQNGYRWIDAAWLPRNYTMRYGYSSGRYDYYGRPVYYPMPSSNERSGYAYSYDHRPEYRSKSYSSSQTFNNTPKTERTRVTQEYRKEASTATTPAKASTNRNTQETIRVRTDESQPLPAASRTTETTTRTSTGSNTSTRSNTGTTTRSNNSDSKESNSSTTRSTNTTRSTSGSSSRSTTTKQPEK